jgi:hypothetical protein
MTGTLTPAGRDNEDAEVIRPSAYAITCNWFHELSSGCPALVDFTSGQSLQLCAAPHLPAGIFSP